MAAEKRRSNTPLKELLFKEYYRFSFYNAVRLLECMFPDKRPLGQTLEPQREAVRFSGKPGFVFPASDISKLESGDTAGQALMEVTFMGLVGPKGVLPQWYNELVAERIWKKDSSLIAFLNLFNHRLISMFYLAWKKHRLPANYLPDAKDRFSGYLLSLVGLGTAGLAERIGLPLEALIFFCGLLSRRVPSATAIRATVEYFTDAPVKIEQFIERMHPLSPEDQTQLGAANSRLGIDTVCGSYIRECQTKFRVNLGPLSFDDFLRFLPTGDMLGAIFSLVRYMAGIEYEFEVRLFLKREEVPPCILAGETPASSRLGWSTWIKSSEFLHAEDPHITFEGPK